MNKITLHKLKKTLLIPIMGGVGVVLLINNLFSANSSSNPFTIGSGITLILQAIFFYYEYKKHFFRYSTTRIHWKFSSMEEESNITLTADRYNLSTDWKSIKLKSEEQEIEILTDGVPNRTKKEIYKKLKMFYA